MFKKIGTMFKAILSLLCLLLIVVLSAAVALSVYITLGTALPMPETIHQSICKSGSENELSVPREIPQRTGPIGSDTSSED